MKRVNQVLRQNSSLEVKTCETIRCKVNYEIEVDNLACKEYGARRNLYIRGLRLWMIRRADPCKPAQKIGCCTFIPKESNNTGDGFYEGLDNVVDTVNKRLSSSPLPGKILNIETVRNVLPKKGALNTDETFWKEKQNHCGVLVLRIYHEIDRPANELIGLVDFSPKQSAHEFEPLPQMIHRATSWCKVHTRFRYCNLQVIECVIGDGVVDTRKMFYERRSVMKILRVLRLAYTKSDKATVFRPLTVTTKVFLPLYKSGKKFRTRQETRSVITEWMKVAGARVLSAQTIWMPNILDVGQADQVYHKHMTNDTYEQYVAVFRVFFDGHFIEPPPGTVHGNITEINSGDEGCTII